MCYFGGAISGCLLSGGRSGFSGSADLNGWFSSSDTSISPTTVANNKIHPRWIADVDGDGCGDLGNLYKF